MKLKNFFSFSFSTLLLSMSVWTLSVSCSNNSSKQPDLDAISVITDTIKPEQTDLNDNENLTEQTICQNKNSDFELLRNNWSPQTLNTESTPTVIDFMNIIKKHYDIKIEKGEYDGSSWEEVYDVSQGYCSEGNRLENNHIYCTLWNRDNGHKLVPFVYGCIHGDCAWCFYDYDPATKLLTLDTKITDQYKDINGSIYNKYGFQAYDESKEQYCIYIWNGMNFTQYASGSEYITKFWKPQRVKAISRSGKPSVVDYMRTFTDYFGYNWVKDEFYKVDIRKGYCSVWSSDNVIECVMWNRNNQHVLVCISLISYYKDDCNCGPDSFEFFFYDYNPTTKTMSAETELTERFKPFIAKVEIDYDFGNVIPIIGKDIKFDDKLFKWNGYAFDFPK